jgi:hypothetical protein
LAGTRADTDIQELHEAGISVDQACRQGACADGCREDQAADEPSGTSLGSTLV